MWLKGDLNWVLVWGNLERTYNMQEFEFSHGKGQQYVVETFGTNLLLLNNSLYFCNAII